MLMIAHACKLMLSCLQSFFQIIEIAKKQSVNSENALLLTKKYFLLKPIKLICFYLWLH